jgi:hypothetical protein
MLDTEHQNIIALDVESAVQHIQNTWVRVASEHTRPCVLFKPRLFIDGDKWCALYGANLQEGVAGFGDTPELAMKAFDTAWQELCVAKPESSITATA